MVLPVEELRLSKVELTTFLFPKEPVLNVYDWNGRFSIRREMADRAVNYSVIPITQTQNQALATSYMYDGIPGTVKVAFYAYLGQAFFTGLNAPFVKFINPGFSSNDVPAQVWQFNVQLSSNVSSISKLRVLTTFPWGANVFHPSGFVVYNSKDRSQVLYSNTSGIIRVLQELRYYLMDFMRPILLSHRSHMIYPLQKLSVICRM